MRDRVYRAWGGFVPVPRSSRHSPAGRSNAFAMMARHKTAVQYPVRPPLRRSIVLPRAATPVGGCKLVSGNGTRYVVYVIDIFHISSGHLVAGATAVSLLHGSPRDHSAETSGGIRGALYGSTKEKPTL